MLPNENLIFPIEDLRLPIENLTLPNELLVLPSEDFTLPNRFLMLRKMFSVFPFSGYAVLMKFSFKNYLLTRARQEYLLTDEYQHNANTPR